MSVTACTAYYLNLDVKGIILQSYLVSIAANGLWAVKRVFCSRQGDMLGAMSLFRAEFLGGELLGGGEGVGGTDFYVELDAGSFPVGLGDGVDGAGKGHANHKMAVNSVT